MAYTSVVLNGVTLNVLRLIPVKKQKTIKSVIGKTLVEIPVIGVSSQDNQLQIEGIVLGTTSTNLYTNRAAVAALDSATAYTYTDGVNNGTYYVIPGSLSFEDSGDDGGMVFRYSMTLIEE